MTRPRDLGRGRPRQDSEVRGLTGQIPQAAAPYLDPRYVGAQLPSPQAAAGDLAAIKQAIAADLAPYDAMHLLANLLAFTAFSPPNVEMEPAATVEYVASILLERPDSRPLLDGDPREKDAAIQRTLDRTRGLTLHGIAKGREAMSNAKTAIEALAANLRASDAIQRWPGFVPQLEPLLRDCFADDRVRDAVYEQLGFTPQSALRLVWASEQLLAAGFNSWRDYVADGVDQAIEIYDSGTVEVPAPLQAKTDRERRLRVDWMRAKLLFSEGLLDALSFTAEELAQHAELDGDEAQAFIDCLSVEWGSLRGLTLLSGRNEVRARPLVVDELGRVLVTSPGNVIWGLRPVLERTLKADQDVFNSYQRRRADYVERSTAEMLESALRPDAVSRNLDFEIGAENGEADVLVRVDDLLIVVEVKSGELSAGARAGRRRNLEEDLEKLVGKASRQTARLAGAVGRGEAVVFRDRSTHKVVQVDLADIARVRSVVVTLEELSPLVAYPQLLVDAGVLDAAADPPWVVSLFNLEIIARSCEFPAQLTGYLDQRRAVDPRVEWVDEDDLWVTHLLTSLDFSSIRDRYILLDGRTEDLQMQWLAGARPPRMKMDGRTRKALKRLRQNRPPGWLPRSEELLERERRGRKPRVRLPVPPGIAPLSPRVSDPAQSAAAVGRKAAGA